MPIEPTFCLPLAEQRVAMRLTGAGPREAVALDTSLGAGELTNLRMRFDRERRRT